MITGCGDFSNSLARKAPRSAIILSVAYFLGIDGGGSQTTFLLGDDSDVLASAQAGASNVARVGEDEACAVLKQGVKQVCRQADIKPAHIAALCAGVAGVAREEIRQKVAQFLSKLVPGQIEVVGDMVVAHHAALDGAAGIVVVAGTGSIAYGRHASGRIARAGGWGHRISDEGSGHWIGVQAVAAVTHALDSGNYTKLSDRILKLWNLDTYDQLIARANQLPPPNFAVLPEHVFTLAEAGDSYARHILLQAGAELAGLGNVVFRRLWKPDDAVKFAVAGGIFQNAALVRESFYKEIHSLIPQAVAFRSEKNAAEGALARARKLVTSAV